MSNEYEDYPVDPLSDIDIERIADGWRHAVGMRPDPAIDVFAFIERAVDGDFKDVRGLEIVVQPDAMMPGKEAFTTSDPLRIFLSQTCSEGARRGSPRDRMTIMHEFFHAARHKGAAPKARMVAGNKTQKFIAPYKSAERQARRFAASILMPRHIVERTTSPEDLAAICNVSLQAAEIRFKEFRIKNLNTTLYEKSCNSSKDVNHSEKDRYWTLARPIPGEDENKFRQSNLGYRIAKSEYRKQGPLGWFERNGRIICYMEIAELWN